MTLREMRKKYLALIEEYNADSEQLTEDTDLIAKQNEVVNQIMFELARIKRIPKYVEIAVNAGDVLTLEDIASECGYEVYQLGTICGVSFIPKASGTVFKILESGTAEIDVFVYPERITDTTRDAAYEFELSADVLEIMPYGIAADLLRSDESAQYGRVYAERYEQMKQQLDPRYQTAVYTVEGGYII